jgi:hypothetical protein
MNPKVSIVASIAVCAVGVNAAAAGPCTTEIDSLTKVIASKDAGSGPTPGASGATHSTAGPSAQPPTAAMSEAAKETATSAEDVRRQTAGQPTTGQQGTGGPTVQHPPTEAMSQATQGQTAPVTTGEHPPTAVMSEATRTQAAPPAPTSSTNTGEASAALNRARMLDQQGKEAECMEAVRHAKQLGGP